MLKKIFMMFIVIVSLISLTSSYTAPTYNSINFSLCSGYTAPNYNDINFTLSDSDSCITDTCSCAGLNNNWEVNMSDYCIVNDNCDLGTGKLSFVGTGNFTCNSTIDTTNLGEPPTDSIIWINSNGRINIR